MIHRTTGLVLVTCVFLLSNGQPRAGAGGAGYFSHLAGLRLEIEAYVDRLAPILEKHGIQSVQLGAFTGTATPVPQHGDVISLFLREELERRGIRVAMDALLTIAGDFGPYEDREAGLTGVKLAFAVSDEQGTWPPGRLPARLVHGNLALACLCGATVDYPRAGSLETINAAIVRSLAMPDVHVRGGVAQPGPASHFAMELVQLQAGVVSPVPVAVAGGAPTAKLSRGEPFAIRLYNRSFDAAAATLAINGVNAFTFADERDPATGQPLVSFVLLPPRSTVVVHGWHRRVGQEDVFTAGTYPDVEFARRLHPGPGLQITAFFSNAWRNEADAPKDDPSVAARCGGSVRAQVLALPARRYEADQAPLLALAAWSGAIGEWSGPLQVLAQSSPEVGPEPSCQRLSQPASLIGSLSQATNPGSSLCATAPLLNLVDESKGSATMRNVGWTRTAISLRVNLSDNAQ